MEQNALWGLGHVRRLQGRHGPAADHYRWALALTEQLGARNGRFEAHHGLAGTLHAIGQHDEALAQEHSALDLATQLGNPAAQARAHDGLAGIHLAAL
jgi:hypothetical protein